MPFMIFLLSRLNLVGAKNLSSNSSGPYMIVVFSNPFLRSFLTLMSFDCLTASLRFWMNWMTRLWIFFLVFYSFDAK